MNPDAELHLPLVGKLRVPGPQLLLDRHRTGNGIDHTWKLREQVVANGIDDPAPVLANESAHRVAVRVQRLQRRHLILGHEAAVADRVGAQERGELALRRGGTHL